MLPAVPERVISIEEEKEQKEKLKTSWELVAILDFISTFQPYLNLHHLNFSAEELESCLVLNNGSSGLLPELHMVCPCSAEETVFAQRFCFIRLSEARS